VAEHGLIRPLALRVTQGERCNWSSVTPRAITISPVKTRLARAKALELRSNICAMNAFPACGSFSF
jgi:hypothetical protein